MPVMTAMVAARVSSLSSAAVLMIVPAMTSWAPEYPATGPLVPPLARFTVPPLQLADAEETATVPPRTSRNATPGGQCDLARPHPG